MHSRNRWRTGAAALVLTAALLSAPAAAQENSAGNEALVGAGSALCSLLYGPVKVLYAVGGGLVGGLQVVLPCLERMSAELEVPGDLCRRVVGSVAFSPGHDFTDVSVKVSPGHAADRLGQRAGTRQTRRVQAVSDGQQGKGAAGRAIAERPTARCPPGSRLQHAGQRGLPQHVAVRVRRHVLALMASAPISQRHVPGRAGI